MRHWLNRHYKALIISSFLIPIITVALVSISHVTIWYGISNPLTWAVYLSVGIEIAALSALAAIAANMGRNVYFPFIVVTLLQFIGNVFFSYNYIDVASPVFKSWVELVSPLLQFIGVEPTDIMGHKRFLSFFAGGMLPIISLSFLHMLIKFTEADRLKDLENDNPPQMTLPENIQEIINDAKPDIGSIDLSEQKHKEDNDGSEDEPTALANSILTEEFDEEEELIPDKENIELDDNTYPPRFGDDGDILPFPDENITPEIIKEEETPEIVSDPEIVVTPEPEKNIETDELKKKI